MPIIQHHKCPTAETIVELCLTKLKMLPKTGKPTPNEWTVIAGIVQHDADNDNNKVVALGLGTKCIGRSKMCHKGLILNDSHAEVLARRAFLRYIYEELKSVADDGHSIFQWNHIYHGFELKDDVCFHFMSTHTPCGDACIVEDVGSRAYDDAEPLPPKQVKLDMVQIKDEYSTAVYTGAKLIGQEPTSICGLDCLEQTVGALRTKPGRGERTLSMSCSDKLARWNIMGVQGALLDVLLVRPIYFKTHIFCAKGSTREDINRAIYGRWSRALKSFVSKRYAVQRPVIDFYELPKDFVYAKTAGKQAASNGLVWCDVAATLKPLEICVNGKRQGVTSKSLHTSQGALRISKFYILQDFIAVVQSQPELRRRLEQKGENQPGLTYAVAKRMASAYYASWDNVKTNIFGLWTQKPQDLLDFTTETV